MMREELEIREELLPRHPPSNSTSPTSRPAQANIEDGFYYDDPEPLRYNSFSELFERVRNSEKNVTVGYFIWFLFGFVGLHHFYLKREFMAVFRAVAFSFSILFFPFDFGYRLILPGIWWIVDGVRMKWLVLEANRTETPNQKYYNQLVDAYILWFPFGIFGFHRIYLDEIWLALGYFLTAGYFGIGWLIDLFLIPKLLKEANARMEQHPQGTFLANRDKSLWQTILLSIPLSGCFGLHQFYVKRYFFGVLYLITFGLGGMGPIVDLFRARKYVETANGDSNDPMAKKKHVTDAYHLGGTLGIFGIHHIYLENYMRAFAYLLSLGGIGIAWIYDLINMRRLVDDANVDPAQKSQLKSLSTARVCWCPLGGLLGLHHFYLSISVNHFDVSSFLYGFAYFFTLGFMGIGWFLDFFYLEKQVEKVNAMITAKLREKELEQEQIQQEHEQEQERLRMEGVQDLELRQEQDLEYALTLSMDAENDRMAEQQRQLAEEEERRRAQEEIRREMQKKMQEDIRRNKLAQRIATYEADVPNGTDTIEIKVRLTDGDRVSRKFRGVDTIAYLRDWISLQREIRGIEETKRFEIVQDFPKKTFEDLTQQLRDVFEKNQLLSVHEYPAH
eukprot:TRINITY_DN8652_c0_g1_i1.p1 TRINITY_DN8652_c0_g1~~TRINITY_DN8652_c0_g1_i1.p1  ORF type:complete len:617 (-),score=176.31 TRINITY_DN8652_c0_g1_i1:7-1857(-)